MPVLALALVEALVSAVFPQSDKSISLASVEASAHVVGDCGEALSGLASPRYSFGVRASRPRFVVQRVRFISGLRDMRWILGDSDYSTHKRLSF